MMNNFPINEEGRPAMFFGTVPTPLSIQALPGSPTQAPIQQPLGDIAKEDEGDERCLAATQKGRKNNISSISSKLQCSKGCVSMKKKHPSASYLMVMAPARTTKKRALQDYQNELVAYSSLLTSNSFSSLRIVKKNSASA